MRNKHKKHFSLTLLISLAIHFFILTVLFTIPDDDTHEEYKKVRVKLGLNNKLEEKNGKEGSYDSFVPSAGAIEQSQTEGNSTRSVPAVEGRKSQIAQQMSIDEKEIEMPEVPADKGSKVEANVPQLEVQKVVEKVSKEVVIPKAPTHANTPKPEEEDDDGGTVIGNSRDRNANKLASYEQMLPLWLDKFKQYPTNPKGWRIEGEGEVFIKIDRKGKVLLSKVIKSTGSLALDKALMKMIEDADPVLPVPDDYHADKKTFSYKIAFEFKEPRNDQ